MDASNDLRKSVSKRPLGKIWLHFERKEAISPGKFGAECKYCSAKWKRGEMPILKEHLANHCLNAPALVLHTYMVKIRERINTSNKKKKADTLSGGQTTMKDFYDSTEFLEGQKNQINRRLLEEESTDVNKNIQIDLFKQNNLTLYSHTATYLAKKIEDILEQIGAEHIFTIVFDNTANVRKVNILAIFFRNSHLADVCTPQDLPEEQTV
ncbi:ribonuclease H-like domain-containing protein [Rhizophagus clarus]|uniref:Ribonuclease H-like domain-containing protein n=1 Tax=Rhizophagus clarus TaxID=94130 RepID=A0A8H3L6Y9_9GLOM|nr:ribonuclease H-like domain-containing protein [Rhizophagus clarus]